MAKSLRSKSKRAFRAKKRTSSTSDYYITEASRVERLSKRLTETSSEKCPEAASPEENMQVDEAAQQDPLSSEPTPKVSTSGPRMSGREVWKASRRGIQIRRTPATLAWNKKSWKSKNRR
ncbi:hypothetical protein O181_040673 [Austropuccinia psidii MF-1]|uniref:DUF2423 domain-containing protein n=1 Tax=Austropuccinia psidii MF-1 TaxID=1389203 RepID=A0A9Q3DFU5_9BASI|nr:hypothetical protein [Austropuccinia psidii MF-1]